jgi:hypothetical protein
VRRLKRPGGIPLLHSFLRAYGHLGRELLLRPSEILAGLLVEILFACGLLAWLGLLASLALLLPKG